MLGDIIPFNREACLREEEIFGAKMDVPPSGGRHGAAENGILWCMNTSKKEFRGLTACAAAAFVAVFASLGACAGAAPAKITLDVA